METNDYRRRAQTLRELATRPDTPPQLRADYLRLAADWDRLAKEVDALQARPAPGKLGRW